ncbi:unnamed protein product [Rhodiola kirilowii]
MCHPNKRPVLTWQTNGVGRSLHNKTNTNGVTRTVRQKRPRSPLSLSLSYEEANAIFFSLSSPSPYRPSPTPIELSSPALWHSKDDLMNDLGFHHRE